MADEQTSAVVESSEVVEQATSDSEQLGDGGKKALEAERKARADAEKVAKDLKAQIDALNDSKLTETQRLEKQLNELTAQYQAAQVDALRNRVIAEEAVPAELAGFVAGDSEEALRASAKALLSAVAEASKPRTPAPDPSQGASGKPVGGSTADQFGAFLTSKLS